MKYIFIQNDCLYCDSLIEKLNLFGLSDDVEISNVDESEDNEALYNELSVGRCEGVPFLFNNSNGLFLCGDIETDELKQWLVAN